MTGEISDGRKRIFEALCQWARTSIDASSFIRKIRTEDVRSDEHRSVLDAVRSILSRTLAEAALDEAVHLLLSHFVLMRFEMLHEGSVTEASTVASLADHLRATERGRADDLWRRILALVRVSQGRSAEFDRKFLVARMNGAFHLRGAPSLRGNLAHLSEDATLAAAEIANGVGGVNIARQRFIDAARSALEQHRFVQLGGLAGTGKSAVLRAVVEEQRSWIHCSRRRSAT